MATTTKTIDLATIAKQAKVAPKIARRKLRASDNVPKTSKKGRWVWPTTSANAVKKIIAA